MIKNKKLLISLIIAVLLVIVAGIFIWRDIRSKNAEIKTGNGNVNISVGTNNGSAVIKNLSSGEINLSAANAPDLSKPIIIKANFSADVKDALYKKLQGQIDLLKKDGSNFNGWIVLGDYREMAVDYDGAAEAWNYAATLNPKAGVCFYNLGFLYGFYLKDLAKAETNYLKSISNDSQNFQAYIDLADLYWADNKGVKQTRIENILEKGIDAVTGDNKNAIVLRLAKYYEDIKDYADAGKYYDIFLKAEPNNTAIQEKVIELQKQ